MKARMLAVLIRDIARAEREGRCDASYLHSATVYLEQGLTPNESEPESAPLKETA